jgi:hypothetical protein
MLCALPFGPHDVYAERTLLHWIEHLGGCREHHGMLVADAAVDWREASGLMEQAKRAFGEATIIVTADPQEGWPQGPNWLFRTAAREARARQAPFLWLEPDAIPLKPGWLDELERQYLKSGSLFFGSVLSSEKAGLPGRYLAGTAVYPANAIDIIEPAIEARPNVAWDVSSADAVVPHSGHTGLIQHFWGEHNLPPTFARSRANSGPKNVMTLEDIWRDALIFHRCKDGSLIRLLGGTEQAGVEGELRVVFPFHNGDGGLLAKMLEFSFWLGGEQAFEACLAYDYGTRPELAGEVRRAAEKAFARVIEIRYPVPRYNRWPYAANVAFQYSADFMAQGDSPWLWCEADAVPLRADWLAQLAREYLQRGRPFFGPVVAGRGHMNGVGIYPAETPLLAPKAMVAEWGAWDTDMRPDMIHLCHDASALIQHCWGIVNGQPHPYEGGPAEFRRRENLGWVLPGAVLFHRCKDGSLMDRLREL